MGAGCAAHGNCTSATGTTGGGDCIPQSLDGGSQALTGFTGGYCSPVCTASCMPGGECLNVGSFNRCFQTCTGPNAGRSTCRTGYVCMEVTSGGNPLPYGVCFPSCAQPGNACNPGFFCNSSTGYCE